MSYDSWWMVEGTTVAAMTSNSRTIHAGIVHPIPEMRAYSMSPLCAQYRKRNGERPKRYEEYRLPMLVRNFERAFGDYRGGLRPLYGRQLCRWCVSVWDAKAERDAAQVVVPDDVSSLAAT